jgi:hypothetical protein
MTTPSELPPRLVENFHELDWVHGETRTLALRQEQIGTFDSQLTVDSKTRIRFSGIKKNDDDVITTPNDGALS